MLQITITTSHSESIDAQPHSERRQDHYSVLPSKTVSPFFFFFLSLSLNVPRFLSPLSLFFFSSFVFFSIFSRTFPSISSFFSWFLLVGHNNIITVNVKCERSNCQCTLTCSCIEFGCMLGPSLHPGFSCEKVDYKGDVSPVRRWLRHSVTSGVILVNYWTGLILFLFLSFPHLFLLVPSFFFLFFSFFLPLEVGPLKSS